MSRSKSELLYLISKSFNFESAMYISDNKFCCVDWRTIEASTELNNKYVIEESQNEHNHDLFVTIRKGVHLISKSFNFETTVYGSDLCELKECL